MSGIQVRPGPIKRQQPPGQARVHSKLRLALEELKPGQTRTLAFSTEEEARRRQSVVATTAGRLFGPGQIRTQLRGKQIQVWRL